MLRGLFCCQSRSRPTDYLLAVALLGIAVTAARADDALLRIHLDGVIAERTSEAGSFFAALSGEDSRSLLGLVRDIDRAAERDDIKGIVLIIEAPAMGFAQADELCQALQRFRASGKPVHCYAEFLSNISYMIASASSDITLADTSELAVMGLMIQSTYYKRMLERIGVNAQMLHCGAYKSASEPFTRTEPSPEAAANLEWLLDGLYGRWISLIAQGRGLSSTTVKALIDQAPLSVKESLAADLIDHVGSFQDFREMLHEKYGEDVVVRKSLREEDELALDFENPFFIFQMIAEEMAKQNEPRDPGIAIVHINGMITTGDSSDGLGGASAGSTTLRDAFETVLADDSIKAVVCRIDSPGGSALASDIMWQAQTRLAKKKPFVVSMGNVAASGGYYTAVAADRIFATPSTITASIGVVGGKLVWRELWEDHFGVDTSTFKRGRYADLMDMNRAWTHEEKERVHAMMYRIYDSFKDRIIESRGSRLKVPLESMAGGRVFTGEQALERGLIDELGGLRDAVAYASKKAGISADAPIYHFPEEKDPFMELAASLSGEEQDDEWEVGLGRSFTSFRTLRMLLPVIEELAPVRTRNMLNRLQQLEILQRERVGCFMPFDVIVR